VLNCHLSPGFVTGVVSVNLCCEARFWKAGLAGESRVSLRDTVQNTTHTPQATYRRRRRSVAAPTRPFRGQLLAAFLALVLTGGAACGGAGESIEDARAAADSALEQVEELGARIESLEAELGAASATLNNAEEGERALARRLDKATDRLDKALSRLRKSVDAAGAAAESAAANSSSALANAEDAAQRLNVLRERYDYHLRRYHGGG
jgi:exonuclease VII small subunit